MPSAFYSRAARKTRSQIVQLRTQSKVQVNFMSSVQVRSESISQQTNQEGSLAAWKYPAFRLYFIGQLVSVSGTWMQAVAQQVVVYNLTHSEATLGLVACAQGLPALFLTPFAGVIVDRYSKRKILIFTQSLMMVLAF